MKGQAFIEFTLTVIFVILLLLLAALVLFTFGVIASHYFLVNYTLNKFVTHPRLYQAFREQNASTRLRLIKEALTETLEAGNSLANWLFGSLLKKGTLVLSKRDSQVEIDTGAKIALLLPPNYFIEPAELKFIIYQNQQPPHIYTYAGYFGSVNPQELHLYPVIAVARTSFPPPLSWIGVDFTVVNQKIPKFLRELTGVRGQANYNAINNPWVPTNQGGGGSTSQSPTPTPTPTPCPIRRIGEVSCEEYLGSNRNPQVNLVATFCPGADNLVLCASGCMCVNDDD
jgi:hypothetical protein